MLITDKKELEKYTTEKRFWQGIPGIEVTKKGRIFSTFYSGEIDEEVGNYVEGELLLNRFETFFTEADQAVSEIYHRIFEEKRDKFI